MKKKNGFTLVEVLITMVLIGILAGIMMPTIKNLGPNQEKVLFKKAYSIVERIVFEMINEEQYYPEKLDKPFFSNTEKIINEYDEEFSGDSKFCNIFASIANKMDRVIVCNTQQQFTDKIKIDPKATTDHGQINTRQHISFIASDGMQWILPITNFEGADPAEIQVDINGEKGSSCFYDKKNCPRPDRFKIYVHQDGKITIKGEKEIEYLYNKDISK